MFSALGSIFSIKPRQAENSDTRQGIQRHDPDFERPRKKKSAETEDDLAQDGATVSVDALRIFLENFVKGDTGETPESAADPAQASDEHTDSLDYKIQTEMALAARQVQDQKSGQAAHAASAYQNIAKANEKSSVLIETTDQSEGPALDLSAADIRTIHALIEDLKTLDAAHIEYLHIERAVTFLESLETAIHKAKNAILNA